MVASALDAASVSSLNEGLFLADNDGVKTYKPDKKIYYGLYAHVNADTTDAASYTVEDIWLVSG